MVTIKAGNPNRNPFSPCQPFFTKFELGRATWHFSPPSLARTAKRLCVYEAAINGKLSPERVCTCVCMCARARRSLDQDLTQRSTQRRVDQVSQEPRVNVRHHLSDNLVL